jgi:transcriptional regulator with XRE-family HTH domain
MTPEELRLLLGAAGVNQCELARRIGVTSRTVRYWLSGDRSIGAARREEIERVVGLRVRAA